MKRGDKARWHRPAMRYEMPGFGGAAIAASEEIVTIISSERAGSVQGYLVRTADGEPYFLAETDVEPVLS